MVFARDTPNFIANRIGVFIMLEAIRLMQSEDLTIEEVDALTGPAIGWPRTATFRLSDLVGLDVMAHVAKNFARLRSGSRKPEMSTPPFIQTMLERRWLGDKTGQGFYKKERDAAGKEVRLALDWKTLEYHPAAKPNLPSLEMAKNAERLSDRLPQLLSGDIKKDKAARFHWRLLSALWNYAAECLPEIADNAASVDRAMRSGFNWEMGPFQLWDAAGVAPNGRRGWSRLRRTSSACSPPAPLPGTATTAANASTSPPPLTSPSSSPKASPAWPRSALANGVVRENPGASLVDLGDGVACLELHSKKNAIGEDIVRMITETLRADGDAVRNFEAFVIGGDADQFSVGANLMQLLLAVQEGEWDEVDLMVRAFQRMTSAIKFCPRPGGRRAVRLLPGRRRRNRAGGGAAPGACGALHRASWRPESGCCPPAAAARK